MIEAPEPADEGKRLAALAEYNILDTLPEQDFDDITRIASEICETPIALVSLIDDDRQWFKSHHGLDATETPREYAFCSHAILEPEKVLVVNDASKDERFHDNPLSTGPPNVIFYAGAPLISPEGHALGTLCVIDNEPRKLDKGKLEALQGLANQVVAQLELRKKIRQLDQANTKLLRSNEELERFAYIASHDLKTPLRGIVSICSWLNDEYSDKLGEEGKAYVEKLQERASSLNSLVSGILSYSKTADVLGKGVIQVDLPELLDEIIAMQAPGEDIAITMDLKCEKIRAHRIALQQILQNLLSNAIKYNDKEHVKVNISTAQEGDSCVIRISDNGPGIAATYHERIFELFQTLGQRDRFQSKGTGIGLATVRKLAREMGGDVTIESEPGQGATFVLTLPQHA